MPGLRWTRSRRSDPYSHSPRSCVDNGRRGSSIGTGLFAFAPLALLVEHVVPERADRAERFVDVGLLHAEVGKRGMQMVHDRVEGGDRTARHLPLVNDPRIKN